MQLDSLVPLHARQPALTSEVVQVYGVQGPGFEARFADFLHERQLEVDGPLQLRHDTSHGEQVLLVVS